MRNHFKYFVDFNAFENLLAYKVGAYNYVFFINRRKMSPVTGFGEEGFADKESAHVSKYRCFDQTADDQNMYFAEPIMGEHIHKQSFVWIDQLHAQFTYTFRHVF